MPVDIGDLDTAGGLDDAGRMRLCHARRAHRMPEVTGIVFTQEVVVFHGGLRNQDLIKFWQGLAPLSSAAPTARVENAISQRDDDQEGLMDRHARPI